MRTIFTTGQVAKICKVAPRTVSKWFDSGRLRGYRIPGSQDRRIPRANLISFLKEHGMPLGELEAEVTGKILLVGVETTVRSQLSELMGNEDFKIEFANGGFEAGTRTVGFQPDCLVLEGKDALAMTDHVRQSMPEIILVALLTDEEMETVDRNVFNETFRKPFDTALLAERIRTLVNRKKQLA